MPDNREGRWPEVLKPTTFAERTLHLLAVLGLLLTPTLAWGYRPFVSTDAAVADPEVMEIELGYFNLERTRGESTFVVPRVILNYGLLRDLELVGEFDVEKSPGEEFHLVHPGLFLKAVLKEGILQEKEGHGFAVEAGPLLPSSLEEERNFGFEGIGILSGRFRRFTYHLNFGGGVRRTEARPFGIWGMIGEFSVLPNLRVVGEVNGESARREFENDSGLLGVIWQIPSSTVFLDAGIRRSFSHGPPDTQVTVGLTFDFGLSLPSPIRKMDPKLGGTP